jgi:hypothetical protein
MLSRGIGIRHGGSINHALAKQSSADRQEPEKHHRSRTERQRAYEQKLRHAKDANTSSFNWVANIFR